MLRSDHPAERAGGGTDATAGVQDNQPYGKTPGDFGRVLDDLRAVELLLRKAADQKIHTTMPVSDVVSAVLRLARA